MAKDTKGFWERAKLAGLPLVDRLSFPGKELHLVKPYSTIKEVADLEKDNDNIIRIYKNNPESVTLQIRTFGPTNQNETGKDRNMIATTSVNLEEWEAIDKFVRSNLGGK